MIHPVGWGEEYFFLYRILVSDGKIGWDFKMLKNMPAAFTKEKQTTALLVLKYLDQVLYKFFFFFF